MNKNKLAFNANGYLESGFYDMDLETFKHHFVDAFIIKKYLETDVNYSNFLKVKQYYFDLFSEDRKGVSKGIVQLKFEK